VKFSSLGSADSDGTIASQSWNFGDGATSTEANPTHIYTVVGTYSAVLTVTDNAGAKATSAVSVVVSPATTGGRTVDVSSFTLTPRRNSFGTKLTSIVRVLDKTNNPVAGVALSLRWSGVFVGTLNRTTDANGEIRFTTQRTQHAGSVTVTIASVTPPSGTTYDQALFTESMTETVTINQ
jgi:PKD repeat protein